MKMRRVRIAAQEAMSIDVSFFPLDIGRALLELDLRNADVFALIESELGIDIGFADITMSVVPGDADVTGLLKMAQGDTVIRTERLTHDVAGQPLDFEYLYVRPDVTVQGEGAEMVEIDRRSLLAALTVLLASGHGALANADRLRRLGLAEPPIAIRAPELNVPDLQGALHRVEDYRGKITVVSFWATWCPPVPEGNAGARKTQP